MQSVRIITVTGVLSVSQVQRLVLGRYPDARIRFGEEARTLLIVIPDLLWHTGHAVFFGELCQSGVIGSYSQNRYSDQEDARF